VPGGVARDCLSISAPTRRHSRKLDVHETPGFFSRNDSFTDAGGMLVGSHRQASEAPGNSVRVERGLRRRFDFPLLRHGWLRTPRASIMPVALRRRTFLLPYSQSSEDQ